MNRFHSRPNEQTPSLGLKRSPRGAFTLIELLVVITIIGILVSVIAVASIDGLRTANLKATQALVLKLDLAVKERLQALLDDEVYPNATHMWLATPAMNKLSGSTAIFGPLRGLAPGRAGNARAKAIAMTDYLRAEMPDVFVLNTPALMQTYPLNFCGVAQTMLGQAAAVSPNAAVAPYTLPIGTGLAFNGTNSFGAYFPPDPANPGAQINKAYNDAYNYAGTGVFGASYTAVAGIYKQLGYGPAGYDGVDNNANGLVDEMAEGLPNQADRDNLISTLQTTHTHKTARSEMLYALLVEGQGPLGSSFSRDDFTDREIQDTDGDGLMEFVDSWGEPLQFYRWPLWYTSDNQRGWSEYPTDPWFTRERDPIDPSNSLVALDWWYDNAGVGNDPISGRSGSYELRIFEHFFHTLTESSTYGTASSNWDRTGMFKRRAYRFTPLILSSGPDTRPGIRTWGQVQESMQLLDFIRDYESLGVKFDYYAFSFVDLRYPGNTMVGTATGLTLDDDTLASAEDDISSHALQQGQGGGAR